MVSYEEILDFFEGKDPELCKDLFVIFAALDEAHALRWLMMAEKVAGEGEMPEKVVEAGMITTALQLLREKKKTSEWPYWKFLAGVCGLGLTDEQRLLLMKPVENEIRKARSRKQFPEGFVAKVNEYSFPDDEADRDFVEKCFEVWITALEETAQGLPEASDEDEEESERGYLQILFIHG
ncbi:MAG: hypothetical protein R6V40_01615 [Candidatus Moraniibacteriota bacterium]